DPCVRTMLTGLTSSLDGPGTRLCQSGLAGHVGRVSPDSAEAAGTVVGAAPAEPAGRVVISVPSRTHAAACRGPLLVCMRALPLLGMPGSRPGARLRAPSPRR